MITKKKIIIIGISFVLLIISIIIVFLLPESKPQSVTKQTTEEYELFKNKRCADMLVYTPTGIGKDFLLPNKNIIAGSSGIISVADAKIYCNKTPNCNSFSYSINKKTAIYFNNKVNKLTVTKRPEDLTVNCYVKK